MILFIVAGFSVIMALIVYYTLDMDCSDALFIKIARILVPLIIIAAGIFGTWAECTATYEKQETLYAEIVSIKDNSEIEGNFILGTGGISEKQYYYFYKKLGEGYKIDKLECSDCIIFEENIQSGYINKIETMPTKYKSIIMFGKQTEYHIYIPEGSIIKQFNLDLE